MEIEQYIECYKFCLKQGWVHNTPEIDVVKDYFHSTKGRKVLFENHLMNIPSKIKDIHILIGEAPPYYPNDKYPSPKKRNYFYNPEQNKNTGYFKEPCGHFLKITDWDKETRSKEDLLNSLADKGVLIFDIFPFPVFQSTDIRGNVVWDQTEDDENAISSFYSSRQSKFNDYLTTYFSPRFKCLLNSFEDKDINIYMFAPKLASVQFLYWFKDTCWINQLTKFNGDFTKKDFKMFMNKSLNNFVFKLAKKTEHISYDFINNILIQHPIFMNESGNPDFKSFVNGEKK